MDKFNGGCLCGNVRIVASGSPRRVGICHCMHCRKHHGALFYAAAIFAENAVTIEGETCDYAAASPGCRRFRSRGATSATGRRRAQERRPPDTVCKLP